MRMNNQKGFTLIELILVIVILGILAVAALPTFTDLSDEAGAASMNGVAGAIRSGIGVEFADNVANNVANRFPDTLDASAAGACSTTNLCFGNVVNGGVSDGNWASAGDGVTYTYTNPGTGVATQWVYTDGNPGDPNAGTFQPQ